MRDFTLIKANIRHQKGSFLGLFLLIFIVTASFGAVLTVYNNAHAYEKEQMERIGFGDIASWVTSVCDVEELIEEITALPDTERVDSREIVMANYEVNGEDGGSNAIFLPYETGEHAYYLYEDDLSGYRTGEVYLDEGEVFVSPAFVALYAAKIGDMVVVEIAEGETVSYTIRGFFEDPVCGSAMMGIKTILINRRSQQELARKLESAGDAATGVSAYLLYIFQSEDSTLSLGEVQQRINTETDLAAYATMTYQKSAMEGFMLIMNDVFAAFLLVFILVLLVVAVIVLGHSIGSSMELDYVDMGILKAVGLTGAGLRRVQIVQYLAVIGAGMAVGLPVSALVVRVLNRIMVPVTGIWIPQELPLGMCVAVLFPILAFLALFICVKTRKIAEISPIRAIRGGAADIYFKKRFSGHMYKTGVSFWLALRQLTSGMRQYVSACLVAALLVFSLSVVGRIGAWMGSDGRGMMDAMSMAKYDFGVIGATEDELREINASVEEYSGIEDTYESGMLHASINSIDYLMYVVSKPEYYNVYQGRTCLYDNELCITEIAAGELGVGIGDTVTVSYGERSADFMISGIYQCANDVGRNFGISMEGFYRLADSGERSFEHMYLLEEPDTADEIYDRIRERYGERIYIDDAGAFWSGMDSILLAMSAISVFMYVITCIFILVVVTLTGGRILYREKRDLGIYRSLGFPSGRLRVAFGLRFGVVAAAGSFLGMALSAACTDAIVSEVLLSVGVANFTSRLDFYGTIVPMAAVTALFFAMAYLISGRIRKIEPGILIVE